MKKVLRYALSLILCFMICLPLVACKDKGKDNENVIPPIPDGTKTITYSEFKDYYKRNDVKTNFSDFTISSSYTKNDVVEYGYTANFKMSGNDKLAEMEVTYLTQKADIFAKNGSVYLKVTETTSGDLLYKHKIEINIFECIEEGDLTLSRYANLDGFSLSERNFIAMVTTDLEYFNDYFSDESKFVKQTTSGIRYTLNCVREKEESIIDFKITDTKELIYGYNSEINYYNLNYNDNKLAKFQYTNTKKAVNPGTEDINSLVVYDIQAETFTGTIIEPDDLSTYPSVAA